MPYETIIWTDANVPHLAAHGVTQDEFEQALVSAVAIEQSRSSDRMVAFGYTTTGRRLACVYEIVDELTIHPITAYEV
ncbi:MAG: hypothetical protein WD294_13165 [Phycisphaeraceae bacterium]